MTFAPCLIDKNTYFNTVLNVFGSAVLVLEIVGVFPDIDAIDGGAAGH